MKILPTNRPPRGSAVITVLVLAAVTAVIAASFLSRSVQESRMATRSFFQSVALSLAEAGVEEGLLAANSASVTTAGGWTLVPGTTTHYMKSITSGFNFQQATGAIHIRVENPSSLTPVIIAAGVITLPNQPSIAKQIRIGCTKRRLWSNGIVAEGKLTFSGNTVIDAYRSSVGPHNSATNRTDQATVATASTALDPIVVGSNTSIYGYVATAGGSPVVGPNGRIYGATTPSGTLVDLSRIRYDFTTNLPDVANPTSAAIALPAVSNSLTLPRTGDAPGADGRYRYSTPSVSLAGGSMLTVLGPVDLVVTGNISVSGNASMNIGGTGAVDPSLNLYSPGTLELGGNGVVNATSKPENTAIWGTAISPATQTITIAGNGSYIGTIYAPNSILNLAGNGATSGAVIAQTVTISGNGHFHYDVDLGGLDVSADTSFKVNGWSELTGTSGAAFARETTAPFSGIF